jgi:broad specificity phosphatase PhoE
VRAWVQRGEHASRIDGGESFDDLRGRFVPFVRDLQARYPDPAANLALVTHGGLLRLMLPLVLANVDAAFALAHPIGHAAVVLAEAAEIGLVCLDWAGVAPGRSRLATAGQPGVARL